MEIVIFIAGLVFGIASAWFLINKRTNDAVSLSRSEGQVELALLNERLTSASEESKRLRNELSETEQQSKNTRQQLETSRNESAQLSERASRVPILEQELRTAITNIEEQNQQISALRQKIGATE